jgi:uncharacterized protein (TIGR03435 family)
MARCIAFAALPVLFAFLDARPVDGQSTAKPPEFEVASIKLNKECAGPSGPGVWSPGSLSMQCVTLRTLIGLAYPSYEGENRSRRLTRISGGPAWLGSDYYTLAAKAEGTAHRAEMEGPMLRALLEQRFKVKVHTETGDAPVYALTVARNGSKLQPLKEGGCLPYDTDHPLAMHAPLKPGDPKYCATMMVTLSPERGTTIANYYG